MTPHPHRNRTALALSGLLALAASAVAALALAGPAAASPCGDQVLADWFDNGRIDRLYPPHCYEDAIDSIPGDLGPYVDAEEVISRALQSALRGKIDEGGCDPSPDGSPDDCKSPGNPGGQGGQGGKGGKGGQGGKGGPGGSPSNGGGPSPGGGPGGPQATPEIDTSGPSAVPVPLLVLGGMSLALLAAGGLGYVARRRQAVAADALDENDTVA